MTLFRLFAVGLIATVLSGCQSLVKDDPILGDKPWQPGSSTRPNPQ